VKAQKSVMEFLLINHPLDCPICDQGGECQLQDLAVGYGGSESRYKEEKRVVFHKNVGPLISMEEMTRCIHCTRCVRFGQEVAGVMELGMLNRGEHSEITTFVGQTVDSELSGNMIDLCPVGALTSKPFRYSARTWELSRRKSVSPHDGLGANLSSRSRTSVMRVVPLENEDVNECWISDKDRFSYEGLNSAERLTADAQAGRRVDGNGLADRAGIRGQRPASIKRDHGADRSPRWPARTARWKSCSCWASWCAAWAATTSTSACAIRFLGRTEGRAVAGMPVADVSTLQRALVIGSSCARIIRCWRRACVRP
jgi:NADH-quinone oxidoreductase subunit G